MDGFDVDDDRARIDLRVVHRELQDTYWAKGRSFADVERSWNGSTLWFGLHRNDAAPSAESLAGFARVLTDGVTFAYLADVVIRPGFRGRGLGGFLVNRMLAHPELDVNCVFLFTADATTFYESHGWRVHAGSPAAMVRAKPGWCSLT